MGYKLNESIFASELSDKLGLKFEGVDLEIKGVSAYSSVCANELSFTKDAHGSFPNAIVIVPVYHNFCSLEESCFIISENPRLDFIRVLAHLKKYIGFDIYNFESDIHHSVEIGRNVVIESGCIIGEGSVIEHNVVIRSGVRVGKNCMIRSSSVIGAEGFGFEKNNDGYNLRFTHLGGVVVGDNVEIGSINSIVRGALSDTIISDNVVTDNLVHIAHNCSIGKNTIITACAELSGSVTIGENCWLGPNCSIKQKILVGANALVGIGAVVTKNVVQDSVVAGNPARILK